MKINNLYPVAPSVDIGNLQDNDPPVFEPINEYLIPNAYINSNGYIFKNFKVIKETVSFRHRDSVNVRNVISSYISKKKIKIKQPAISIMSGWNDNFYHFTLESLPKLFVLRKYIDSATVIFPQNLKNFHKQWIELLKLSNITYLSNNEIVNTPLAISSTFTSRDLNHHSLIIPEFRKWILEKNKGVKSLHYKKIFVGRKNSNHRKLLNLDEVKSLLKEKGFTYLEMEDYDLSQQINFFSEADQIVCIHGAALTHLCFSKKNTAVIDLIHNDFYQWCYLKLSQILKLNYLQFRCCGDEENDLLPGYKNIYVNVIKLAKLIDSL